MAAGRLSAEKTDGDLCTGGAGGRAGTFSSDTCKRYKKSREDRDTREGLFGRVRVVHVERRTQCLTDLENLTVQKR